MSKPTNEPYPIEEFGNLSASDFRMTYSAGVVPDEDDGFEERLLEMALYAMDRDYPNEPVLFANVARVVLDEAPAIAVVVFTLPERI